MKKFILLFGLIIIYLIACSNDQKAFQKDQDLQSLLKGLSPTGRADWYAMPKSDNYLSLPNQDPKNPATSTKAALGKMLFFETGIGMASKQSVSYASYSCSSCHVPEKNFTAGRFQGIADGGIGFGKFGEGRLKNPSYDGTEVDAQGARPLPTINLSYVQNPLWNGSFGSHGLNEGTEDLWGKADPLTAINKEDRAGLEAVIPRALIVHRQLINKDLIEKLGYKTLFDNAFPESNEEDRYSIQNAANAIAIYFRTILTNQAPFQKWLNGDYSAMTEKEKDGAILFFGKAGCFNCHNSPSLNGQKFAAVGVKNLDQNNYEVFKTNDGRSKGRASFTLNDRDLYKFKVPQLYNLKDIGFYFHGASKHSLREVVEYFNEAIPENPLVPITQLDRHFRPLELSEEEINNLVEFLDNGLFDPNIIRYKPNYVLSGNCFPNNDIQSRIEMNCL